MSLNQNFTFCIITFYFESTQYVTTQNVRNHDQSKHTKNKLRQ